MAQRVDTFGNLGPLLGDFLPKTSGHTERQRSRFRPFAINSFESSN